MIENNIFFPEDLIHEDIYWMELVQFVPCLVGMNQDKNIRFLLTLLKNKVSCSDAELIAMQRAYLEL